MIITYGVYVEIYNKMIEVAEFKNKKDARTYQRLLIKTGYKASIKREVVYESFDEVVNKLLEYPEVEE